MNINNDSILKQGNKDSSLKNNLIHQQLKMFEIDIQHYLYDQEFEIYEEYCDYENQIIANECSCSCSSKEIIEKNMHIVNKIEVILSPNTYKHLFVEKNTKSSEFSQGLSVMTSEYYKYFEQHINFLKLEKFLKLISITKSYNRIREKFIKNEIIERYYDSEYDINNNNDVIDHENMNNIIHIPTNNFLHQILESYTDDSSIVKQMLVDFPRQNVFINDQQIYGIESLMMSLSPYNREIIIENKNRYKISTMMLSMCFICQTSFFVSFVHNFNKIAKMKQIYYNKSDQRHNLHLTDTKGRKKIKIYIDDNKLSCVFIGSYKIINIETNTTLYNISTETIFDINSDVCLVVNETYHTNNDTNVLYQPNNDTNVLYQPNNDTNVLYKPNNDTNVLYQPN